MKIIGIFLFLMMSASSGLSEGIMDAESDREFNDLGRDLAGRAEVNKHADEIYNKESMIHESDRDQADIVLRRTAALLADLRKTSGKKEFGKLEKELSALTESAKTVGLDDKAARRELFNKARALRRRIALSNPVLDFDKLLFMKKHRATYNHMCDQYYGVHAVPGGGIFVLDDPFGKEPKVRNVLENSVVTKGRLKGQKLDKGAFLSPDLSYDGKTILFAYVECEGEKKHRQHYNHSTDGHWSRGRCYHVFKVNSDGSGLEQLTDGTFNDFDPCWLPNGRIIFNTERRGGYLRCGRECPTYTIFDMKADGSDIRCLSFHETNEWHPSVMNDGMIVFTRWDYIDRYGCTAHHPWIMSPDGRDPRAVHGNFAPRPLRPDMEVEIRAIPGSHKLAAVAAPHHGHSFGSLIIIDPRVEDDDAMAPVKRVTPDVGFPESQVKSTFQVYSHPWPLSDKYFLCVYDMEVKEKGLKAPCRYGLYLVDCFGNRELIYRDPEIGCHNPIPLRARKTPPVVPDKSERVAADKPAEATVGVVNVYNTSVPLPEGTKVRALRIYKVIPAPMGTIRAHHQVGIKIPQAPDSLNIGRAVLGTVPVEEDGSAFFKVPARVELFFQVLDEKGMAVTSMRSATQFQPGERGLCQGCHEPRHGAVATPGKQLMAFKRPPSEIKPSFDGTNPFSYPKLIQPILDKNCLDCHKKHPDKAPRLDSEMIASGKNKWYKYYASYHSLMPKYGFNDYGGKNQNDPKWYRTTPGEFGAKASKLYAMLEKGHHKVKLSDDDMQRIIVWLDSTSPFYGVFEKEGAEAQLRLEDPKPTLE